MSTISKLASEIHEPPTLMLNEKARLLRERGEAVIHLGAGEPKSKVPIDAVISCATKLTSADIRYTPTEGIPSLLKAIIRYTRTTTARSSGRRISMSATAPSRPSST